MDKLTRQDVFVLISDERDYQMRMANENEWLNQPPSVGDFLTYMQVYLDQAKLRATKERGFDGALDDIRKVAALAVSCMEQHGAPARQPNSRWSGSSGRQG